MENNNENTNRPCTVFKTKWFSIEAVPFETPCSEPYYRLSCDNSVSIIARTVEVSWYASTDLLSRGIYLNCRRVILMKMRPQSMQ